MIEEIKNLYVDRKRSVKEVADELGLSFWKVYELMKRNNIQRRGSSEANYISYDKHKPRFLIKENITVKDEYLKIAGIMLYWAEGTRQGYTVDFANSDTRMVKVFLRFLREICGINESRLRLYLYAFSDQDIEELKRYWSRITQIPLSQFTKPYIRKYNSGVKTDRRMPHGLIHVRYNDKRLLQCIKLWLGEYSSSFS